jgi:hypothetical protein
MCYTEFHWNSSRNTKNTSPNPSVLVSEVSFSQSRFFTQLTAVQRHYVQSAYTDFCLDGARSVENMGKSLFLSYKYIMIFTAWIYANLTVAKLHCLYFCYTKLHLNRPVNKGIAQV